MVWVATTWETAKKVPEMSDDFSPVCGEWSVCSLIKCCFSERLMTVCFTSTTYFQRVLGQGTSLDAVTTRVYIRTTWSVFWLIQVRLLRLSLLLQPSLHRMTWTVAAMFHVFTLMIHVLLSWTVKAAVTQTVSGRRLLLMVIMICRLLKTFSMTSTTAEPTWLLSDFTSNTGFPLVLKILKSKACP